MKKLGLAIAFIWLAIAPALAANVNIDGLPAASSVTGTDLYECEQSGTNNKCTPAQLSTYLSSTTQTLTNKSLSASQVNSGTLAAAQMPALTGDITTSAGAVATTLATVNSNVGSFGSATSCAAFTVNGKGLITAASASTCAPAIGSVTGLGTGVGTALGVNTGSAGAFVVNGGALGTPTSGTATNLTGLPIAGITGLGTGVGTALANTISAAAGLTSTIFHGTAVLGTGAITSGTCATAVNVTAANVATTDVVTAGFSADPTGTTGYLPTAMLTIVPYVASAGNIAVKVCNLTSGSITPSALTINVSAVR